MFVYAESLNINMKFSSKSPQEANNKAVPAKKENVNFDRKAGYFKDGLRQVDLILVYTPQTGFDGKKTIHERNNRIYRKHFLLKLKSLGLQIEEERSLVTTPPTHFVKLHATWKFLSRTAELVHIQVPIAKMADEKMGGFLQKLLPSPPEELVTCSNSLKIPYKQQYQQYYVGGDDTSIFFTASQRSSMVVYEVERTRIKMKPDDARKNIDVLGDVPTASKTNSKADRFMTFPWFIINGVFDPYMAPHDSDPSLPSGMQVKDEKKLPVRAWLSRHWVHPANMFKEQPMDTIQQYLGPEIAFYFAWLGFYTKMLILPAFASIIAFIYGIVNMTRSPLSQAICNEFANLTVCRKCLSPSCDYSQFGDYCRSTKVVAVFDNYGSFVFSLFTAVWCVAFQELWVRKQYDLAKRWGTLKGSSELPRTAYLNRAKDKIISPVTLKEVPHINRKEKFRRVATSIVTVTVMILILVSTIVGIIVYRIAITQSHKLFEDDGILKSMKVSQKLFASITSSIISVIVISFMSAVYPRLAWRLTEYECPRTDSDFKRSYTFKAVLFQFFNYYGTIFYLTFFAGKFVAPPHQLDASTTRCGPQGCMMEVTVQLIIVMTIKPILQNITELGMSLLKKYIRSYRTIKKSKSDVFADGEQPALRQAEKDFLLNPSETPAGFSDYQEMVVQYGFLAMFGPAFPLGAFFALLNNLVEIRLDAFKYIHDDRRPIPKDVPGLGPWLDVLRLITKLSVIVNGSLIAFSGISIENISFRVYHPTSSLNEYVNNSFSIFNTEDYCKTYNPDLCGLDFEDPINLGNESFVNDTAPLNTTEDTIRLIRDLRFSTALNTTIEYCYYRGSYHPPGDPKFEYTNKPLLVQNFVSKLMFLIIFQNAVILLQSLISSLVPPESASNKMRTLREQYLQRQLEAKEFRDRQDAEEAAAWDDDSSRAVNAPAKERKKCLDNRVKENGAVPKSPEARKKYKKHPMKGEIRYAPRQRKKKKKKESFCEC